MSPMPREPPVTRATLPSMEKRFDIGGHHAAAARGREGPVASGASPDHYHARPSEDMKRPNGCDPAPPRPDARAPAGERAGDGQGLGAPRHVAASPLPARREAGPASRQPLAASRPPSP